MIRMLVCEGPRTPECQACFFFSADKMGSLYVLSVSVISLSVKFGRNFFRLFPDDGLTMDSWIGRERSAVRKVGVKWFEKEVLMD